MLGQLAAPKNLCVLRLSAISDVCYAVAAVQHIQKQWPHTQITWVCGKVEANLLSCLKKIEIIALDESAGIKGYLDFRDQMKGQHFEILLNMQASLKANLASFYISANRKVGFDIKRAKQGQWLFTNTKIEPQSNPHLLDDFMGFTKILRIKEAQPFWEIPISENDIRWAKNTLFSDNTKPIAIINLAESNMENNWHITGYVNTAEYLHQIGYSVVICNSYNEEQSVLAEKICLQSNATINSLTSKVSVQQLLAVLKLSHITIGPNSSITHMSVAVGTPVVGLYAQYNPQKVGPYLYQKYVVSCYDQAVKEQTGKTKAKLPWGFIVKDRECINKITFEQVKTEIDNLLNDYYPEIN